MRRKVLVFFQPCLLHMLHRSLLPGMRSNNIIGDLFRAAHSLRVASYWTMLFKSSESSLERRLVILHNVDHADEHYQKVARQILELVLDVHRFAGDAKKAAEADRIIEDMLVIFQEIGRQMWSHIIAWSLGAMVEQSASQGPCVR